MVIIVARAVGGQVQRPVTVVLEGRADRSYTTGRAWGLGL